MARDATTVAMATTCSLRINPPFELKIAQRLQQFVNLDLSHWLETSLNVDISLPTRSSSTPCNPEHRQIINWEPYEEMSIL